MGRTVNRLAWGVVAAAVYVSAVWVAHVLGPMPVRLLFDGPHPIQPYNFVAPPKDLAVRNQPAQPGEVVLGLLSRGVVEAGSLTTNDGQASITFPAQTFAARPGQKVRVRITPEDPALFGPPPEGLRIDGNAYTFTAEYQPSGDPATLQRDVTAVLRYPVSASVLLRWDGRRWNRLKTTNVPATLQVFGDTGTLDTLVAAGPPIPSGGGTNWLVIIPFGVIGLAAIAGLRARMRQRTVYTRQGKRVRRGPSS
jgi:hypothetical protein